MRITLVLAFICFYAAISNAAVMERPSRQFPKIAIENHGWIYDYKNICLSITINDTASKFISNEELLRYFKLKMRNFVKEVEFQDKCEGIKNNYMSIKLELYKYNDKTEIHYGLLSLKSESAISWKGNEERIYELTTSISGSATQIVDFIKKETDSIVEVYAEDYFFIEDLKKNKAGNNNANQ